MRNSLNPNNKYKHVDPHNYVLPKVDTSLLPSVEYVNKLTEKQPLETTSYLKVLHDLCHLRDSEIIWRILHRMDCEMQALAALPMSPEYPVYNGPADRDNLEKWLREINGRGLHVIHQTAIALLRGSLDDEYKVEVPQRREFFWETDLAIPVAWDGEGMDRQYAYRRKMVEEAELFGYRHS